MWRGRRHGRAGLGSGQLRERVPRLRLGRLRWTGPHRQTRKPRLWWQLHPRPRLQEQRAGRRSGGGPPCPTVPASFPGLAVHHKIPGQQQDLGIPNLRSQRLGLPPRLAKDHLQKWRHSRRQRKMQYQRKGERRQETGTSPGRQAKAGMLVLWWWRLWFLVLEFNGDPETHPLTIPSLGQRRATSVCARFQRGNLISELFPRNSTVSRAVRRPRGEPALR